MAQTMTTIAFGLSQTLPKSFRMPAPLLLAEFIQPNVRNH